MAVARTRNMRLRNAFKRSDSASDGAEEKVLQRELPFPTNPARASAWRMGYEDRRRAAPQEAHVPEMWRTDDQ
jgi:hypothetical protein